MKTDRLQIRNKFINEENKPYIIPNNDDHNYTSDYVKWLEDKLVDNINYTRCCTELKDKEILNFEVWLKKEKITEVKEVYYKCCGIDLSKELVDKAFKNRNL